MTAQLRAHFAMVYVDSDGVRDSLGSLESPVFDGTITGTGKKIGEVTIAAGETESLWAYGDFNLTDFEVVVIRIKGTGFGIVKIVQDTPTSTSDDTASGNDEQEIKLCVSCKIPFILNADDASITAGQVDGKVYEVKLENPDDTDAIVAEVWVLN